MMMRPNTQKGRESVKEYEYARAQHKKGAK